jgi:hypothetical protein
MPLWKKGEHTIKQPVCVGDVAQGILNAARNIDTNGQIYQAIGYIFITYRSIVFVSSFANVVQFSQA